MKPVILLVAVNARYGHCSLAVRTLLANLGSWRPAAALLETDLEIHPLQLAADIAARAPRLAGFSVYLWNCGKVRETLAILRRVAPAVRVVVGGPEIAPGCEGDWRGLADLLVAGEGETALREACDAWLERDAPWPTGERELCLRVAAPEDLGTLVLPDDVYTDADIAHRTIFVESSRGCPCRCTYCTSGGTRLRLWPLEQLEPAFDRLLARGVLAYRFLDRSFNAAEEHACRVLDFFLARHPGRLQLHFEIVPRRLGAELRRRLRAFPPGVLHLEVGVQTLNPAVAHRVRRDGGPELALETLQFLMQETGATVHADLIFGLPGEDEASFGAGFDRLVRLFDPPELQLNILKRLPGTPLADAAAYPGLVFNPHPPYELLAGDALDFAALTRLQGLARIWELIHNRGRFPRTAARLWQAGAGSPFARYRALSAQIQADEGRLYALNGTRLAEHLSRFLETDAGLPRNEAQALVAADRAADRPASRV